MVFMRFQVTQLTAPPEKKSMADLEETLRHLGPKLRGSFGPECIISTILLARLSAIYSNYSLYLINYKLFSSLWMYCHISCIVLLFFVFDSL